MIDIKKELKYIIFAGILLIAFALSMILFLIQNSGTRRSFIFPSADTGKYIVEYRNISNDLDQSDIYAYVEDLLLGSGTERTKMLFTPGTRVKSCFLRNGVLYLNLSDDLIKMGNDVADIDEGVEILKKNIKMNFKNVKKIELFVDGKYAYEGL